MICSSPYRIDFQPTLIHAPNQNFVPSERTPVRWLKALHQQQSPNCVASVQLEPKWPFWSAAILDCLLHPWNTVYEGIMPWFRETKLVFMEVPSGAFIFKRRMHPMSSSLATHRSFQAEWTARKQPASAVPNVGIAWHRMVSLVKSQGFSWTLEASLDVTDTRRKKNTLLHVNLTQQHRFEWW